MISHRTIQKHLLHRSIVSYCLYPLSILFSFLLVCRRSFYKLFNLGYRAPVCIISIGNITVGGSGKTPFTIYLAELLCRYNLNIAVSHRGYKSALENMTTVISDLHGLFDLSELAGDESKLLAKRLKGIPIVVGKNRVQAIKKLVQIYPKLDCIILDDSLQHLKVKHDVDIVILNNNMGLGNGFVLPAGYLREPVSVLDKTDIFIVNKASPDDLIKSDLSNLLVNKSKSVFYGAYSSIELYNTKKQSMPFSEIADKPIILLSGIGNPQNFADTINQFKPKVIKHIVYPDHFSYESISVRKSILQEAKKKQVQWIVTTEKDYAKLKHFSEFSDFLLVLKINFALTSDENALLSFIIDKINHFSQTI